MHLPHRHARVSPARARTGRCCFAERSPAIYTLVQLNVLGVAVPVAQLSRYLLLVVLAVLALVAVLDGSARAGSSATAASTARRAVGSDNSGGDAQGEFTFGIRPATARAPDDRTSFAWGATPGATLRDHLAVVNYGTQAATLRVYATDAVNTTQGGFGLLPTGATPQDAGSWIRVGGSQRPVTVPARTATGPGTVIMPIAVQVPRRVVPGDHSAGVLAVLTTVDNAGDGPAVRLEQRVGTRVFVTVAGDLRPGVALSDVTVGYSGSVNPLTRGVATVSYTLRNVGNVNVSVQGSVQVSGLLQDAAAPAPVVPLLLPGSTLQQSVRVPGLLPQGLMSATVALSPQVVTSGNAPPASPTSASVNFWAVPWALLASVIVLLIAAVWWRRRRRKSRTSGRRRASHSAPSGRRRAQPRSTPTEALTR